MSNSPRRFGPSRVGVLVVIWASSLFLSACSSAPEYDLVIRGGTLYDGSGAPGVVGDLALSGDRIVALGDLGDASGAMELDASGMAVAPGFINLMSWATETMIEDGRAMSDILQGVTLEVMGEGESMGPIPCLLYTSDAADDDTIV